MIVCIAEKPSVARDIARIIGANSSRQGYMEGNGYQVRSSLHPEGTRRLYVYVEVMEPFVTAYDSPAFRHQTH